MVLWWIKEFNGEKVYFMSGNGGNKIAICPSLELTIVITSTNYNNRNAHNYSDEIMNAFIIPAIKQLKG